jgi:hypothetical protein
VTSTQRVRREKLENRKLIRISAIIAALALLPAVVPVSHAYGPSQWETAFSANCNSNPAAQAICGPGHFGFWGWCAFAGGTEGGTSGTAGDCQITQYFNPTLNAAVSPTHISVNINAWMIRTVQVAPGVFVPFFFATSSTFTCTGPGTCPPPGSFNGDTGIPALPGHFTAEQIFGLTMQVPGLHFIIQVNQLP